MENEDVAFVELLTVFNAETQRSKFIWSSVAEHSNCWYKNLAVSLIIT